MTRRRWAIAAALAAAIVAAAVLLVTGGGAQRGLDGPGAVDVDVAAADFSYVIPAGTGARLDRGEAVELLPPAIDARVGQTVRIVNRDDRDYRLGPFVVGAGETLTQRFTHPGEFTGVCVVHPSGELRVTVTA